MGNPESHWGIRRPESHACTLHRMGLHKIDSRLSIGSPIVDSRLIIGRSLTLLSLHLTPCPPTALSRFLQRTVSHMTVEQALASGQWDGKVQARLMHRSAYGRAGKYLKRMNQVSVGRRIMTRRWWWGARYNDGGVGMNRFITAGYLVDGPMGAVIHMSGDSHLLTPPACPLLLISPCSLSRFSRSAWTRTRWPVWSGARSRRASPMD